MGNMSKQEVIEEMVSEGYDYDSAYRLVFGNAEISDGNKTNKDPDCEQAFNDFYGTSSDSYDDADSDLDLLACADEAAAYNERYESVMRQDFPKDFADDDPFTAALLDWCEQRSDDE